MRSASSGGRAPNLTACFTSAAAASRAAASASGRRPVRRRHATSPASSPSAAAFCAAPCSSCSPADANAASAPSAGGGDLLSPYQGCMAHTTQLMWPSSW